MEGIIVILLGGLAVAGWCRAWGVRGFVETVLFGFVSGIAMITMWGAVLSGLGIFGQIRGYMIIAGGTALAAGLTALAAHRLRGPSASVPVGTGVADDVGLDSKMSLYQAGLILPLAVTAAIAAVLNLIVVFGCAPNNGDSLCCHIARVAYYLQQGSMRPFGANYFAQETSPKACPAVLGFLYVVGGRDENLMQLFGFGSYMTAVAAVYGITRRCGCVRVHALLSAGFAAILTEWLMQANSTQDHMPLTACVGALVYFLLAYRQSGEGRYLAMAALTTGVAFAVKSTFVLALPSIAVVAAESLLFRSRQGSRVVRDGVLFACTAAMFVGIAVFIGGYAETLARFGNLLGPRYVVTSHTFAGMPPAARLHASLLNAARYGIEFLAIDGAPDFVAPLRNLQLGARRVAADACLRVGLDVRSPEAARTPFADNKSPSSSEDMSFWGILGFALLLPLTLASALMPSTSRPLRTLAVAVAVYFAVQSFVGPYTAWHGRYFSPMAIFAAPVAAAVARWRSLPCRGYAITVTVIACLFAMSAVTFRPDCRINPPLLGGTSKPFWKLSRIEQLSLPPHNTNPDENAMLRTFDRVVPSDAIIAVALPGDMPEYALFGERLTRTLLPINPFEAGPYGALQPIPERAEWLLFSAAVDIAVEPRDLQLPIIPNKDACYLRRLR